MKELRILAPTAILGYGFPESSLARGLAQDPHLIAVDAGSSDPGPFYLGSGRSFTDRSAVKRDLELLLPASLKRRIPLVIGSAGGAGGEPHLAWTIEIIQEIAQEKGLSFKLAQVPAEIPKTVLLEKLDAGKIEPLGSAPELTKTELEAATRVVGQMGPEPLIKAFATGADVYVLGRAYDPVVFAALAIARGYNPGLAIHLGKILECAAIAAVPGSGSDCMLGFLGEDYFSVEPTNPQRECTTLSVSAHTLYEKADPRLLPGPGGSLDLSQARFLQETDSRVRVEGSRFLPEAYKIKLEGAKKIGYRTVSVAGVRDPIMIQKIDQVTALVAEQVRANFNSDLDYFLDFKLYGKNAVMGKLEPVQNSGHELGIVIEAVAPNQQLADTICSFARSSLLHYGYEGRISTAGNLAFPFSPSDFSAGEVYEFNIHHLVAADPLEFFPTEVLKIGAGDS